MGKHLKILGLSLLALVGVMAVSASAAQAKWLLLSNGASTNLVSVDVETTEPGKLLVPELGLNIECQEGVGSVSIATETEEKVLSASGSVTFTGCKDPEFEEVCDVSSAGQPAGTIVASGSGLGGMNGKDDETETYAKLEASGGKPFTTVNYTGEGEECPLEEIDGRVSGYILVLVLNALASTNLKLGHVIHQGLKFGENEAILEDSKGNEQPLVTISRPGGVNTWGIHLVGL